jgi:hypothetical protein
VRLAALKIGFGVVEPPFHGEVHSVFARAIILKVAGGLVTLVPSTAGGLPGAIMIDTPVQLNFTDLVKAGDTVAARAGVLRFAGRAAFVDLRPASRWQSNLHETLFDFELPPTIAAWRTAATVLQSNGGSAAIAGLAPAAILSLCAATRQLDVEQATGAATRLIGLGAGGTPAGDDLLVGFLAALWPQTTGPGNLQNFRRALAAYLRAQAKRTNDVSRVYLEAATTGEVSERLGDVVTAIAAGADAEAVAAVAAAAVVVGHTSGADGMLGLLLGLAARGPSALLAESRSLIGNAIQRHE